MDIISFQKKGDFAAPYTDEDLEKWNNYKENQIIKAKVTGYQKQRSATHLGLLMACIKEVVDNTENENWSSRDRAKLSLKAMLGYVDTSASVVYQNRVIVKYRSFAFDSLKHMEACNLFERAYPILAGVIGVSVDELISEAKSKMLKHRKR